MQIQPVLLVPIKLMDVVLLNVVQLQLVQVYHHQKLAQLQIQVRYLIVQAKQMTFMQIQPVLRFF